jgi:hypothetical protein
MSKRIAIAAALALAGCTGFAHAQTSSLGISVDMNGESGGTVTGAGAGTDGAFGTPSDARNVGAARGSTSGAAASGTRSGTAAGSNSGGRAKDAERGDRGNSASGSAGGDRR